MFKSFCLDFSSFSKFVNWVFWELIKLDLGFGLSVNELFNLNAEIKPTDTNVVLSDNNYVDINKITLDSRLEEDLELSSVALIYFAVMIEEQFDISLEDEKLSNFKTINDVINCIIKKA